GLEVRAMDIEFGRSPPSVGGRHYHDVLEPLLVMVRHAGAKGVEAILADTPLALVHVVNHIVADTGQHAVDVAAIESVVVAADQFLGLNRSVHRESPVAVPV